MRSAVRVRVLGIALFALALLIVPAYAGAATPARSTVSPVGQVVLRAPVAAGPTAITAPHATPAVAPAYAGHELGTPAAPYPALGSKWTSSFFNDVNVTFTVPYVGGQTFVTAPFRNQIPMEATGFWMNITAIKPIVSAAVTIWGWNWPTGNATVPIANYLPSNPLGDVHQMYVNTTKNTTATFFFNDYKNFWPGDRIDFNLSVTALGANPATVNSTTADSYTDPVNSTDYATWIAQIGSPWASPDFNSSIEISTSPDVLSTPAFEPNPHQPLQVILTAIQPAGRSYAAIPAGQLNYTYSVAGINQSSVVQLTPANGSTVEMLAAMGPFPNANVQFQVTLWLPWFGGAIDFLKSPIYSFNWSTHGGWAYPNQPLETNALLTTYPQVMPPADGTVAPGQPVNISLHEPAENISIASSQVNYVFHDGYGNHEGSLPMRAINLNSTYLVVPGLPPSSSIDFSVTAKDVYGVVVFSSNYTYAATATPATLPTDHGFFFFEALDVAGTGFVPNLNYSLSNASWAEAGTATPFGFGGPTVPHGVGYLILGYGTYALTVSAFGRSFTTIVTVDNGTPFTVVFYVAASLIPLSTTSSLPTVTAAAVVGLLAGMLSLAIVWPWFKERRKRIEAEQRRITL